MLDKIFSALTIVRHAVAITVVTGAAGAMVAGSVDTGATQHSTPSNTATMSAPASDTRVEKTTATAEPKKSEAPKPESITKGEPTTKSESTTKPDTERLGLLIKDCLAKYEAAKNSATGSEDAGRACRAAIEASGLASSDFWARFGPKPTRTPEPTRKTESTRTPEATRKPEPSHTPSVTTAQLELMVKDCFAKYLVAKNTGEGGAAAAEACNKAIAASGLSKDAFFAKFGTPGSN